MVGGSAGLPAADDVYQLCPNTNASADRAGRLVVDTDVRADSFLMNLEELDQHHACRQFELMGQRPG